MRGKAPRVLADRASDGITPAYAGKRRGRGRERERRQDHPRVCGEKRSLSSSSRAKMGSPPRVRGKERKRCCTATGTGITPAYAGKSRLHTSVLPWRRDHPRICGEKERWQGIWNSGVGSPPRMRGKASGPGVLSSLSGITPAYAGKSPVRELLLIVSRDHPRVCGEKLAGRCPAPAGLGSPPRMRGKAWLVAVPLPPVWDHPRVCGEKFQGSDTYHATQGSPPRMRGKVRRERGPMRSRRITPAYAGKRHNGKKKAIPGQDHPRVCGEKPCPGC